MLSMNAGSGEARAGDFDVEARAAENAARDHMRASDWAAAAVNWDRALAALARGLDAPERRRLAGAWLRAEAVCRTLAGDLSRARIAAALSHALDPGARRTAEARLLRARLVKDLRPRLALAILERAHEAYPRDVPILFELAGLALAAGPAEMASAYGARLAAANPRDLPSLRLAAAAALRAGLRPRAGALIAAIQAIDPTDAFARENLMRDRATPL